MKLPPKKGTPGLALLEDLLVIPADELRALGIAVSADLPGVGANLHDHVLAPLLWESARKIPPARANNLEAQFFATSDSAMTGVSSPSSTRA